MYNQSYLEATQLFKLSRRPGQGRLSLDFFNKPGETEDEEETVYMQTCLVLEPFTTCNSIGTEAVSFQKTSRYLYLPINFALSLFHPNMAFLGNLSFPDH